MIMHQSAPRTGHVTNVPPPNKIHLKSGYIRWCSEFLEWKKSYMTKKCYLLKEVRINHKITYIQIHFHTLQTTVYTYSYSRVTSAMCASLWAVCVSAVSHTHSSLVRRSPVLYSNQAVTVCNCKSVETTFYVQATAVERLACCRWWYW